MRTLLMPLLAVLASFAALAPGALHAKCGVHTLDQSGACKGATFHRGESVGWTKGSELARDPYAYTRQERVDYEPAVRSVHVTVTGTQPTKSIARYYAMRMQGGWSRARVERDIRGRYGERQGSVVVGPVVGEAPARAPDDDGGHDRAPRR